MFSKNDFFFDTIPIVNFYRFLTWQLNSKEEQKKSKLISLWSNITEDCKQSEE